MSHVLFEVHDGVATLTLNRPAQKNAIDLAMRDELANGVQAVARDRAVRALVLAGAGGDLRAILDADLDAERGRERMRDTHAWLSTLLTLDRPVIAAVDGPAFGAGFGLALAADFVVASPRARFCLSFLRVGLVPDYGIFHTLPRVVGVQRAKELMLSAREVPADEAKALGIVAEIVPAERVLGRAHAVAAGFAQASSVAVSLVKRAMAAAPGADLATMLDIEANAQALCFGSTAHRVAAQRFIDKQPPLFQWPVSSPQPSSPAGAKE